MGNEADHSLNIAIRIISQQTGEKPEAILQRIKAETLKTGDATVEANKRSAKSVEEHEGKVQGLNKALGLLSRVGGETGRQLHNLYQLSGNALTIGIAAAAFAISSIIGKWQEWKKSVEDTQTALNKIEWTKFNSIIEGLKSAAGDLNKLNRDIRDAGKPDDDLKSIFDQRMAVIQAEIEAKQSLLKLNEELELSNARLLLGGDKDKEELANVEKQIRARYGSARAGLETSSDKRTVQELENELAIREGNAPGLQATAEGVKRIALGEKNSPIAAEVAARIAELGGPDGKVEKLRAKSKAADSAADSWSIFDLIGGDTTRKWRHNTAVKVREELEAAVAELGGLQTQQTALGNNQQDLDTTANQALGKFTGNASRITSLREQIAKRRRVDPIQEYRRATESMYGLQGNPAADDFLLATAGAHNIRSGGRATPDQANAINNVAKVQGFTAKNIDQLLKILDGLFGQQEKLSQALERYERKLSDLSHRTNTGFQRP